MCDKAPGSPVNKLFQLRLYLPGEALKDVEPLGHSAAAYKTAKERLERTFDGKRRQIALHLEVLENFNHFALETQGTSRDLQICYTLL